MGSSALTCVKKGGGEGGGREGEKGGEIKQACKTSISVGGLFFSACPFFFFYSLPLPLPRHTFTYQHRQQSTGDAQRARECQFCELREGAKVREAVVGDIVRGQGEGTEGQAGREEAGQAAVELAEVGAEPERGQRAHALEGVQEGARELDLWKGEREERGREGGREKERGEG